MSDSALSLAHLYCEFADVVLPSTVHDGPYRVRIHTNAAQTSALIWLESKTTKQQWQCVIEDFATHMETTYALPNAILLAAIKNGLATVDRTSPMAFSDVVATPASSITLGAKHGALTLGIAVQILPEWTTSYSFAMTPKKVDVVDILEARIRDLQEIITRRRVAFCTVTSVTSRSSDPCAWTVKDAEQAAALIHLKDDDQSVVVLESGVYTIHCVGEVSGTMSSSMSLDINSIRAHNTSFTNNVNSSHNLAITHVAHLDAGASIRLGALAQWYASPVSMTIFLHERDNMF
ncbi:hypothetical protein SDRG_02926 [Saprolegnia diclina VS20]|uniref:Uncharacterized protein n=1 Tax=Saprolegnia diclina (strain VS20) TaxID=1156394 RepID=T0QZN5_SAPDV|nr:hypothetical protein SDRG_02926 [Saprolegnia diclina VS20]EQC39485.1 hypothetical protein SDRG_02926 [Saprolegnia diclina VS20]|eukprot:XP_008606757.1 hypothetical protein SDRG_02926 [Saprolegnia diclina VS20]